MSRAERQANAAMYAIQTLVDGLRNANALPVKSIDEKALQMVSYAFAREHTNPGDLAAKHEAEEIRHGMAWLRQCLAGWDGTDPNWNTDHPKNSLHWPVLSALSREED